jgi:hypothetical protein
MKKIVYCTAIGVFLLLITTILSCSDTKKQNTSIEQSAPQRLLKAEVLSSVHKIDFIPQGYVVSEEINGDLNKDGIDDCVILIKGTDRSQFVEDENRGTLDRNRRGVIVLLKQKNRYTLVVKNEDCFSSENEDGGVYFAPELSVSIEKGNVLVHYGHGRYGYWQYTFKLHSSDLELIGYDASSGNGPVTERVTSINFLTKKKQIQENTNEDAEGGDEVFKETWESLKLEKTIRLSEIEDFDNLIFP